MSHYSKTRVATEEISYGPSDMGKLSQESRTKYDQFCRNLFKYREALPFNLRVKMADHQIRDLARSLLDDTIFDIVQELEDIQSLRERQLLNHRMKVVGQHKMKKLEMTKRHKEIVALTRHQPHRLPLLKTEHEKEKSELEATLSEEVKKADKNVILELDQLVSQQQTTLCQAAVPFFFVTNNAQDIQVQMNVLRFILKLSQLKDAD